MKSLLLQFLVGVSFVARRAHPRVGLALGYDVKRLWRHMLAIIESPG